MTSHDLYNNCPPEILKKLRRRFPKMSEKGLRLYLWRRRDWTKTKKHKCSCGAQKHHPNTCNLNQQTPRA